MAVLPWRSYRARHGFLQREQRGFCIVYGEGVRAKCLYRMRSGMHLMRRALLWQIIGLQAADAFLTWWLLTSTGAAYEGNPVVAGLLGHGFSRLLLGKLLGVLAIAYLAHDVMRPRPGEDGQRIRRRTTAGIAGLWLAWSVAVAIVTWDSIGVGLVWWYA